MTRGETAMDLAKNVFQVHAVDAQGRLVVNMKVRRAKLVDFFASLPRCLVGLEACAPAHHWAREIAALAHDVRLMPPPRRAKGRGVTDGVM